MKTSHNCNVIIFTICLIAFFSIAIFAHSIIESDGLFPTIGMFFNNLALFSSISQLFIHHIRLYHWFYIQVSTWILYYYITNHTIVTLFFFEFILAYLTHQIPFIIKSYIWSSIVHKIQQIATIQTLQRQLLQFFFKFFSFTHLFLPFIFHPSHHHSWKSQLLYTYDN